MGDERIGDDGSTISTQRAPFKATLGMKLFLVVVTVGFFAAGYGGLKTYFEDRKDTALLKEEGVTATANVLSTNEVSRTRGGTYFEINVSYDPPGDEFLEFAQVLECSEESFEPGTEEVEVVFVPGKPDLTRLATCESSVDSILPLVVGIVFPALALLLLWRTRRFWTS